MRAKFKVVDISGGGSTVLLEPIVPSPAVAERAETFEPGLGRFPAVKAKEAVLAPENDKFFEHSPSGELRLICVAKEVADEMQIGREFYVDLTPA